MNTFRLIAACFVFAAVFAISGFAQTTGAAQTVGVSKIVVVDTTLFGGTDEKGTGGIAKYVSAFNALNGEFAVVQKDLDDTAAKLQTMQKEIQTLQATAAAGNTIPIKQEAAQAKVDAFQALQVDYKRKQEDAKAKYERRQEQIMGPVMQDIGKALQAFTTQKGYGIVFDSAKLFNANVILGLDESKVDVTKEFIIFYNTRPGTTATTVVPK